MWYQATWCKRKQFHSKRRTIRWMEDDSQLYCSFYWLSLVPSLESVPMRMIVIELGPRDWSHCSKETTGSAHSQPHIQWISKFDLGVPTRCSILFTDFKTVFIFALRHFVPMVSNFMIKWPRLLFVAIWPLYLAQQIQPSGASLKRVQKCSLAILTR